MIKRAGAEVNNPVFIISTSRSGSTIIHYLLAQHPSAGWLSGLCNRYPHRPGLNRWLLTMIDYPLVGLYLRRRFHPGENYLFWENYCRGFSRPYRDLLAQDVTRHVRTRIPQILAQTLTARRSRLLMKLTGWPRIGFLREIFPDAKFIHLVRDGRAVACSLLRVDFWQGWRGPSNWRWGALAPAQQALWEHHHCSFVALAGIQWNILIEATEKAARELDKNNFLTVKYEELCRDPIPGFKAIAEFCELDWAPQFEQMIHKTPLVSKNDKWRRELTEQQQQSLEEVVCHYLNHYHYL